MDRAQALTPVASCRRLCYLWMMGMIEKACFLQETMVQREVYFSRKQSLKVEVHALVSNSGLLSKVATVH